MIHFVIILLCTIAIIIQYIAVAWYQVFLLVEKIRDWLLIPYDYDWGFTIILFLPILLLEASMHVIARIHYCLLMSSQYLVITMANMQDTMNKQKENPGT